MIFQAATGEVSPDFALRGDGRRLFFPINFVRLFAAYVTAGIVGGLIFTMIAAFLAYPENASGFILIIIALGPTIYAYFGSAIVKSLSLRTSNSLLNSGADRPDQRASTQDLEGLDFVDQRDLFEKLVISDLQLRDAIEAHPDPFVVWDADDRLVFCNSSFQRLHKLPDSAVKPGTSYETVIEVGSMPEVRTRLHGAGDGPGARTFEAELADGRWLHISERRTKDGGYVSVGTDITRIKEHERKLIDNDLRLRATVVDLKHSQIELERQALELADLLKKYSEGNTRAGEVTGSKVLVKMRSELRTPINAIVGLSEIMSERVDDIESVVSEERRFRFERVGALR